MATQKVPVTFLNGFSSRKDVLGVISLPDMVKGGQLLCRIFFLINGQWGRFGQDLDIDGKSMTHTLAPEKSWWILGKNGEVVQVEGTTVKEDQIPGAGLLVDDPYGYVNTIKNIGGELFVCGYGRQVYQRRNGVWLSIAADILTHEEARGFFDIDGTSPQSLYAVGWHGEIYYFDGKRWQQDDSPTNVHLASVRCLSPDNVWIAGNKGTVLHGQFNKWEVIQDDKMTGNWYCIEEYNGKIYLAGNGELGVVDGKTIKPVDTGLGKVVTTHRLHSKEGLLWSIGEKHVLSFDGNTWKEHVHPDLVP